MKKILFLIPLLAALGGCASFNQKVETAWNVITSASVTPQQIIIAGNAFDAAKATTTQYLRFCHVNLGNKACALSTRQKLVSAVRAGTAARNTLEPYALSGSAGPMALYNTLMDAVTTLEHSTPVTGASK